MASLWSIIAPKCPPFPVHDSSGFILDPTPLFPGQAPVEAPSLSEAMEPGHQITGREVMKDFSTVSTATKSRPREKKTKGRVKIKMEFIDDKQKRYTSFSKRKAGLLKKASELAILTRTEVLVLVASETDHVYHFATPRLQPMISSVTGQKLIHLCLNSNLPDQEPTETGDGSHQQRMDLSTGGSQDVEDDDEDEEDNGLSFDEDDDEGDSSSSFSPSGSNGMETASGMQPSQITGPVVALDHVAEKAANGHSSPKPDKNSPRRSMASTFMAQRGH